MNFCCKLQHFSVAQNNKSGWIKFLKNKKIKKSQECPCRYKEARSGLGLLSQNYKLWKNYNFPIPNLCSCKTNSILSQVQ